MSDVSVSQAIAERIRELRSTRGWAAQRLADECAALGHEEISRSTIAKIESGARKSITAEELAVIARALDVHVDILVRRPSPPSHPMALLPEVSKLMAALYFTKESATTVLMMIGVPSSLIPPFTDATSFWATVVPQLHMGLGVANGVETLIDHAADVYTGNRELHSLAARLKRGTETTTDVAPGRQTIQHSSTPTLTLTGADLSTKFLETVRQAVGSTAVELLYVAAKQCAVAIPDPGDQAPRLCQEIQSLMQTYAPDESLQVVYDQYPFRPYLYTSLVVHGPDTTPYELVSVPATLKPSDIAAAIIEETRAADSGRETERADLVIDLETERGRERLDPNRTLHENKVEDHHSIRLGAAPTAGGGTRLPLTRKDRFRRTDPVETGQAILPHDRLDSLRQALEEIQEYGRANTGFEIVHLDDPELPTRLVLEFTAEGLVAPDVDALTLPPTDLVPLPTRHHRVTIELPPMYPAIPPTVLWNTPLFHPNVWPEGHPGLRPGTLCLREIMDRYRPGLHFGHLCALLVEIAGYRFVDPTVLPDSPATRWARTDEGQAAIAALTGGI